MTISTCSGSNARVSIEHKEKKGLCGTEHSGNSTNRIFGCRFRGPSSILGGPERDCPNRPAPCPFWS